MTIYDSLQSEILAVEKSLDTFPHKAKRVLGLYRFEIQRTSESQPATLATYERIGIHRLMSLRLLSQLLDNRTPGHSVSADDRHLLQLLFSTERRLADSTFELEAQFGPLDFSGRLPELFAAEFGIDLNEASRDALEIRARRVHTETHREEILAHAQEAGLL
jgi:hypothetical protein